MQSGCSSSIIGFINPREMINPAKNSVLHREVLEKTKLGCVDFNQKIPLLQDLKNKIEKGKHTLRLLKEIQLPQRKSNLNYQIMIF